MTASCIIGNWINFAHFHILGLNFDGYFRCRCSTKYLLLIILFFRFLLLNLGDWFMKSRCDWLFNLWLWLFCWGFFQRLLILLLNSTLIILIIFNLLLRDYFRYFRFFLLFFNNFFFSFLWFLLLLWFCSVIHRIKFFLCFKEIMNIEFNFIIRIIILILILLY